MSLALLLSLLQASGGDRPPGIVWATIIRAPSNNSGELTLDFGTLGVVRDRPRRLIYFVRRIAVRYPRSPEVSWADSIDCPAVNEVLAGLRGLPTPRIDVPGFPSQQGGIDEGIAVDGIGYRLTLSNRLSYSMNIDSALSRWTEDAIRRLEPCWRTEIPQPAF